MANEERTDPLRDAIVAGVVRTSALPVTIPALTKWTPPTEDEFNDWYRIPEALADCEAMHGEYAARRYVLDRLKSEIWIAASRTARSNQLDDRPRTFQRMPPTLWEQWDDYGDDHFWKVGDASFEISTDSSGYDRTMIRFQDVRIDPSSLNGRPSPAAAEAEYGAPARAQQGEPPLVDAAALSPVAPKGGRPPKDYWEDLLIAMMVRWAEGDLKPRRQADVANAMKDWLDAQNEKWSETTIKERAAKAFTAMKASDNKAES